jgi:hypothetical protein
MHFESPGGTAEPRASLRDCRIQHATFPSVETLGYYRVVLTGTKGGLSAEIVGDAADFATSSLGRG